MPASKEVLLRGVPAAEGIVIGPAFVLEDEEVAIPRWEVPRERVRNEVSRFRYALSRTKEDMVSTHDKAIKVFGRSHAKLMDAYLLIMNDPFLNQDVIKIIETDRVNAEYALTQVIDKTIKVMENFEDEYFRDRKYDIMDVGHKILRHLLGHEKKTLQNIVEPSIVIAHNLTPTDTLNLREHVALGFATNIGGKTSHAALLAQSMMIPAVVGMRDVTSRVRTGDMIIIDGKEGFVIVNPEPGTLATYKREQTQRIEVLKQLEKLRDLPAQTTDGRKIVLAANIDSPDDVKFALAQGAEGIGLYRTEFLFLNRKTAPTEEEHYENYKRAVRASFPHPAIIRTVDIGGDKLTALGLEGISPENNPFLGLRGIRLSLKYPDLFKVQLRAILRASSEGKVKIMYPMVSGVEELRAANALLQEVKAEFRDRRQPFDEAMEVGMMVEVPSAALMVDVMAREVDFFSLGTNDLIQYTLAVDRINENVANLYQPLHLAVLRLVDLTVKAGHRIGGKWVGLCGGMASEPDLVPVLIGLEVDELSVTPSVVPKVKEVIRAVSFEECVRLKDEVMNACGLEAAQRILKLYASRRAATVLSSS
ncbi:MAG: phosphoenolpyruvate--protein phosphotransferase [Elusimicrobia bacterium]|nr:phosphoenolpyruvate--protein phosphotransferase [Candidatus Obscuribacterium magneticum]